MRWELKLLFCLHRWSFQNSSKEKHYYVLWELKGLKPLKIIEFLRVNRIHG